MGSPLGPTLANIFLGHYESKLFNVTNSPLFYRRYVDDTFVIFNNEVKCDAFKSKLNNLHPSLNFTCEKEHDNKLSFLDVLVEKHLNTATTDVFRKPTFTWVCMKWSSFAPNSTKIKLINTLVDRAVKICSRSKLANELERLKTLFRDNGFPDQVVQGTIDRKLKSVNSGRAADPEKSSVTIHLPFIGEPSVRYGRKISRAVNRCFDKVRLITIFTTQKVPVRSLKDVLPTSAESNIIYYFECHCGNGYVGKTSQTLIKRIGQHVPPVIRKTSGRKCKVPKTISSAIGQHLLENCVCAENYNDDQFTILARARSTYHLSVLEAIFIVLRRPILCRQKQFVIPLDVFKSLN